MVTLHFEKGVVTRFAPQDPQPEAPEAPANSHENLMFGDVPELKAEVRQLNPLAGYREPALVRPAYPMLEPRWRRAWRRFRRRWAVCLGGQRWEQCWRCMEKRRSWNMTSHVNMRYCRDCLHEDRMRGCVLMRF